jgi:hypothetical protein
MYYTGINPLDMKKEYATDDYREKLMQRALLQYKRPENRNLVREALIRAGREDLIGFDEKCLVKPDMRVGSEYTRSVEKGKTEKKNSKSPSPKNVRNDKNPKKSQKNGSSAKQNKDARIKKTSTPPAKKGNGAQKRKK